MRKILTTATLIAIGLFVVAPPASASGCGYECYDLDCEYTGDPGTGCESTRWGFCLDAWCTAGAGFDEEAKAAALEKVHRILEQQAEPDFAEIVATLEKFYGPSFRLSTEEGVILDAATITGIGLDQTPQERVAHCPHAYDSEDTAAAD